MGIPALAKAPDTSEAALHHSARPRAAAGVRTGGTHVRTAFSTHRTVSNDRLDVSAPKCWVVYEWQLVTDTFIGEVIVLSAFPLHLPRGFSPLQ